MRNCPICEAESKHKIYSANLIQFSDNILPSVFDVVSCNKCGMIYCDIEYSSAYESFYTTYTGSTRYYTPQQDEISLNTDTADFLCKHIAPTNSAIDIGCSYGVLLNILKNRNYTNLTGIDLDMNAISSLSNSSINAHIGSVLDLRSISNNKYDIVILRHVLEHIHDIKTAIRNCSNLLPSNGYMLIEVPCSELYFETSPFPAYFIENQHINHFTITSLTNLMCDFQLISYEINPNIYPTLRAMFKKTNTIPRIGVVVDLEQYKYVSKSIEEPNSIGAQNLNICKSLQDEKICIWGCGTHVHRLLSHTEFKNLNITALVDKSPEIIGKNYWG